MVDNPRFHTDDAGVLTITFDNPTRGNALDRDGAVALADAFDAVTVGTGETRAILIRGEGKHFCTGADISGGGGAQPGPPPVTGNMVRALARAHHRVVASAWACPVPMVAAVHGYTGGFGLHLALTCDLIVAAESAVFAEPFTDRGFNADSGGSWLLPRFVGLTRAKQLIYTGERIDAATALDWGLIGEVVDDGELEAAAAERAARLASRPTVALVASKKLLHDNLRTTIDEALHAESMAIELTTRSDDFAEGDASVRREAPSPLHGALSRSRSSGFRTLPIALRGSSSTTNHSTGTL